MRRTVLALALLALAAAPAARADSVNVVFTGSATEHLSDVQSWVSLADNECYLRTSIDQSATFTWTLGWRLAFGRPGAGSAAGAPAVGGHMSGLQIGDGCDQPADEFPADAPPDWIHTSQCSDDLGASGAGGATAIVRRGAVVLTLAGPAYALPGGATCWVQPRQTELHARIAVSLKSLLPGRPLTIPVGTAARRWGAYIPHQNCMHSAKPYDGYRSFDACGDDLSWSGTLQLTRTKS